MTGWDRLLRTDTGTSPALPPSVTRDETVILTCASFPVTKDSSWRSNCAAGRCALLPPRQADDSTASTAVDRYPRPFVVRKRSLREYAVIRRTLDGHTVMLANISGDLKKREKR